MPCAICQIRKPRRSCPAVGSDICTTCCAEGREETIHCPRDCNYLREAHLHETQSAPLDLAKIPNQDIEVTEEFLQQSEVFMAYIAVALLDAAEPIPAVTDWDVREAFEALIRTYRTMEGGIYYEARPDNRYAAAIASHIYSRIVDVQKRETEATGGTSMSHAVVLGVLVFLQRLEYSRNNGRKRCRAFLDFLRSFYAPNGLAPAESLEPESPRIIL